LYHPEFKGKTSIKRVFETLNTSSLQIHKTLIVSNGQLAMSYLRKYYNDELSEQE
jgi:hypothetical protein